MELGFKHPALLSHVLSTPSFVDALRANLAVGSPPVIAKFDDYLPPSCPLGDISPTQLRYLLTLLDMMAMAGKVKSPAVSEVVR